MPRAPVTARDRRGGTKPAAAVGEAPAANGTTSSSESTRPAERLPITRGWHGTRSRGILVAGGMLLVMIAAVGWFLGRQSRPVVPAAAGSAGDRTEIGLRGAVEANPNDIKARLALADYYHSQARQFEAIWEYAEARHLAPADPALLLRLADALQNVEMVPLAIPPLREALRARPDDLALRQELAEFYLITAKPQQARAVLEERREAVWQDADAVIALGRSRQAAGDEDGARAAFQQSLALQPEQHAAWYRLGRLHLSRGRIDEARDAFFHAMTALPSQPEHPYYTGLTFLQSQRREDTERAISLFKDALSANPNYAPAYYQQGVALERLGQRRAALSHYSFAAMADTSYPDPARALGQGLAAAGKKADSHRQMGRYYDIMDEPADSVREFQQMDRVGSGSVQPTLLMGQVLIRTGQSDRAVEITEAALKRHPDDVQLLERLAVLKINRGDRNYARRLLHHWLTLKPQAARPCWLLGRCDLGDLRYKEAIAWLEKAIARQPGNAHFHGFLGGGLLRMNTPETRTRAAEALAQAVALAPDDAQYRDLYGQALQRLDRPGEARQQFLRALDAEPLRMGCYTPLLQIAWRLNQRGAAKFLPGMTRWVQGRVSTESLVWPRVWERPEDAVQRVKLARFLCEGGDLKRARRQLEQTLARRPDLAEARQLLATVRGCLDVQ
jgi:tetratricopeptide (TPR) repeat protein